MKHNRCFGRRPSYEIDNVRRGIGNARMRCKAVRVEWGGGGEFRLLVASLIDLGIEREKKFKYSNL